MSCFTPDSALAFASVEQLVAVQQRLFSAHVAYCKKASPYYREMLRSVDPAEVCLADLPLTDKSEISAMNEAFVAVDRGDVADIVFSSGTTGRPTQVIYTAQDLKRLAYNEKQAFEGCGIGREDVVLLTCTMDRCFIAGLAYFMGGFECGAAMIRNGHGTMESHREVILRSRPTVLIGVPSFLRKLGHYMMVRGVDLQALNVRCLVCIGEPLRDRSMQLLAVGRDLESIWAAKVYSTYASSETVTTFCECEAQCGGHVSPDLGLVEIVDDAGRVLPPGEVGEVVVTPLQVMGMPLLRFKTGDISFLMNDPCRCGRKSVRLGPILGRKNQLLKVRGTSLYPQAVNTVLDDMPEVREYWLEVNRLDELSDQLTVHLALAEGPVAVEAVLACLQARLRVKPEVVVEPIELIRSVVFTPESRKPVRFIDRRK
jgi:phenylacetate-CoA ligase